MKRGDAIKKIQILCSRLDQAYGHPEENYGVNPLHVWLFGSVLTDKETPEDIDLVIQMDTTLAKNSQKKISSIIHYLSYGQPMPWEKAKRNWCRGMKMFQIIIIEEKDTDFDKWIDDHTFLAIMNRKLIWEPGIDWKNILNKIQKFPITWDPIDEAKRKSYNAEMQKVLKDEGQLALEKWLKTHPFIKWEN